MKIFLSLLLVFFIQGGFDKKEVKSYKLDLVSVRYVDSSFVALLINGEKVSGNVYYIDFFSLSSCRQLAQIDGLLKLFSIADYVYKDKNRKSVIKYGDLHVHTPLFYDSDFLYQFNAKNCLIYTFGGIQVVNFCKKYSYMMYFNSYQLNAIYNIDELVDPRIMCNLSQECFKCTISGVECNYALARLVVMFGDNILYVTGKHKDKTRYIVTVPVEVYQHLKKNYNLT